MSYFTTFLLFLENFMLLNYCVGYVQGNSDERGAELYATDQDVRLGGTLHRQDRGAQVCVTHTVKKGYQFSPLVSDIPAGDGKIANPFYKSSTQGSTAAVYIILLHYTNLLAKTLSIFHTIR